MRAIGCEGLRSTVRFHASIRIQGWYTHHMIEPTPIDILVLLHENREPQVSDATLERVRAFGPAALPVLMRLVEEALEEPSMVDADRATDRAVQLLGALQATDAIPLLLRVLDETDGMFALFDEAGEALAAMGPGAVKPLLEAHAASADPEVRRRLEWSLAQLGVRDEGILEVLLAALAEDPDSGATTLAEYGDSAAVPALQEALDRYELGAPGPLGDHAVIELVAAIEELGGEVSAENLVKLHRVRKKGRAQIDRWLEAKERGLRLKPKVDVRPVRPKLGRNDKCWCGSGKKYKRCHWLEDRSR